MSFDVFGMCNAIYDIQAELDDVLLEELGVAKGSMQLVDDAQQKLESMGWTQQLRQQSDRTSNKPEGTITKQSVPPGTQIDKDQNVTVGVSNGPLFPTSPTGSP